MTDSPPHPENPVPPAAPPPGDTSPDQPSLDELRAQTTALGDAIQAHFEMLEGR
jgi:hypothetical protein